jgi:hypothetical protein
MYDQLVQILIVHIEMADIDQTSKRELIKKQWIKEVSSSSELDASIDTQPNKKTKGLQALWYFLIFAI